MDRRRAQQQTRQILEGAPLCPHNKMKIFCKECRKLDEKEIPF